MWGTMLDLGVKFNGIKIIKERKISFSGKDGFFKALKNGKLSISFNLNTGEIIDKFSNRLDDDDISAIIEELKKCKNMLSDNDVMRIRKMGN